ncbi:NADPH-dependent 7-cyano-7-deazaguanine reductase QueF [Marinilabiliaceae bacterium ANBcel2]|nr:NADPH-dependent 7-cyano-7-deazaguanine reductase QueF [Marinilabiliaceae bacterium ANBcel2]
MLEAAEAKFLGKKTKYPQKYDPNFLVAVPRYINRKIYGIYEENLPFTGIDVWHAWEVSFCTQRGLPVSGVVKLLYPAQSKFIVESKSLKLYLNSFNMEQLAEDRTQSINTFLKIVKKDISKLLSTNIEITFFKNDEKDKGFDYLDYPLLENINTTANIVFKHYTENVKLLKKSSNKTVKSIKYSTHLLRSNCKITNQPDWGTVYIYLKGRNKPTPESLLSYIVSLRNENHFHEEICELIYKRLYDYFTPEELMVTCIYTRRGGIDISPSRSSHPHLMPKHLTNSTILSQKLLRQ